MGCWTLSTADRKDSTLSCNGEYEKDSFFHKFNINIRDIKFVKKAKECDDCRSKAMSGLVVILVVSGAVILLGAAAILLVRHLRHKRRSGRTEQESNQRQGEAAGEQNQD